MCTCDLYCSAKFSWNRYYNFGCYTLSLLRIHMTCHRVHYVKTWRHPQNRKYMTYLNAVTGGPSHSHRQHAKNWWSSAVWFLRYASWHTNTQTDILIAILRTPSEGEVLTLNRLNVSCSNDDYRLSQCIVVCITHPAAVCTSPLRVTDANFQLNSSWNSPNFPYQQL